MENKEIIIKGARENNLKNVDLTIPRDKLVVFTGVSGSGKSSLAFDTIYAEGQRRYVESLSSYARMFLGQMEKPDVDSIEGLSPAISIDQKTTNNNPRSTVGTVTEIYDYMRLLFARIGVPHCPKCGKEIQKQTVDQIVDKIMEMETGTKIQILAPVVRNRKGEHVKIFEDAKRSGYVRVRVDGNIYDISEKIELDKNKKHNIEIVVDRIVIKEGANKRISEAVDTVSALTGGIIIVDVVGKEEIVFSQNFACPDCGISIGEIEPPNFSFNNPNGACPDCTGLGVKMVVDPDIIVPNKDLSIGKGAICAMGWNNISDPSSGYYSVVTELGKKYGFDMNTPFKDIPEDGKKAILYGCSEPIQVAYMSGGKARVYEFNFDGVIPTIERRYKETTSDSAKEEYMDYMTSVPCPICHGQRLKPEVLAVTLGGKNISQVTEMSIKDIQKFFDNLELNEKQRAIGDLILKEIKARIGFLVDVGLDYLSLSRTAGTLSGGEAQRIRLATQIGSGLVGVLYILDEPSIGLHQRDNDKLLGTLKHLRDIGNSLIVVEHDEDTMRESDFIVDVGPYAGEKGGNIVFAGTYEDILKDKNSLTGAFLSGREKIEVPQIRKTGNGQKLVIKGEEEKEVEVVVSSRFKIEDQIRLF